MKGNEEKSITRNKYRFLEYKNVYENMLAKPYKDKKSFS